MFLDISEIPNFVEYSGRVWMRRYTKINRWFYELEDDYTLVVEYVNDEQWRWFVYKDFKKLEHGTSTTMKWAMVEAAIHYKDIIKEKENI